MDLVRLQNVSKDYGHISVLTGVSCLITSGLKLGLIGPNGAGKTSILRLITGEEEASGGAVVKLRGLRLGYVPQHVEYGEGETVLENVLAGHAEMEGRLREQEQRLATADAGDVADAVDAYEEARQEYERAGGDQSHQRAVSMLDSLGLAGRHAQPIGELSGGEKNVLSMTKALLAEPDLLLLDEPANHLDFGGIAWLENFLRGFKGAILIVSHNRYLLDRVVDGVLHLEDGSVKAYAGNYSAYRAAFLRDKLTQQADYAANQRRLEQLDAVVKRFAVIAKATGSAKWGRRLRARRTQLERERRDAVEKPTDEASAISLRFSAKASQADIALQVRSYSKAFGELRLFEDANLDIACGERVALVGANGSGKTTLVRDIIQHGAWDHETIRIGPSLRVGYCAQEQEVLDDRRTVLDELLTAGGVTRARAYDLLAQLLFRNDDFDKLVRILSGGERNRLQLAKVMAQNPNFLILDEPTNHLDIPACEAVEDVLTEYKGTILLVSHDRYLLDKVVDRVVEVRDRQLVSHAGNFSEYWQLYGTSASPAKARVATRRRVRERPARERPARSQALRERSPSELDGLIAAAEEEKLELERRAAAAFTNGDHREGGRVARQLQRHSSRLDELYDRWLKEDG